MITVVLSGRDVESLAAEICRILEKFGGACLVSHDSVQAYFAIAPSFLLFHADTVRALPEKNTVFLQTDATFEPKIEKNCKFDCIITESTSEKHCAAQIITVGMGRQNDIGISSTESGHLHIAVQNTVHTLAGKEILPCEFSVLGAENFAHSALLYAFALLLLAEKIDHDLLTVKL